MILEVGVWLSPKVKATYLEGPFHSYRTIKWALPTSSTQFLSPGYHPNLQQPSSTLSGYTRACLMICFFNQRGEAGS